nr:MAG TPA: winged helix-turn-helix transcription repressor [Caudoviricetes sp.]
MCDVNKVYTTSEIADKLDLNSAYLLRVVKEMLEKNDLTSSDVRAAGKRNYIFNTKALNILKEKFNK